MNLKDRLAVYLGSEIASNWDRLAEIRVRANREVRCRCLDGSEIVCPSAKTDTVQKVVHMLMENSVYACENELREGYFTAQGGCRIGVCGKMSMVEGRISALAAIGSVCIRIPREKKGCADRLMDISDGSLLILSPPGLGKTTMIRDFARRMSDRGENVAIADERGEIAGCCEGMPSLDVGCRTDVMDGCPKANAIPMLVRACAPDWIVADEIGCGDDADALRDAARCGVRIAATAHAASIDDAFRRKHLCGLLEDGIFAAVVVLGKSPGQILRIKKMNHGVDL